MLKWLPYPLLRASAAFVLGVHSGFEIFPLPQLELLWVILCGAYFLLTLKTTSIGFRSVSPWLSALGLSAVFLAGSLRSQTEHHKRDLLVSSAEYYEAIVIEPSEIHPRYKRTVLALQWVWLEQRAYPVNDHIQWNQSIATNHQSANSVSKQRLNSYNHEVDPDHQPEKILNYGDRILIKGAPKAIGKPANPMEFDYADFMSKKNIFWQHWVKEKDIIRILPDRSTNIYQLKFEFRAQLQHAINSYLSPVVSQEITGAMLLGDRSGVSDGLEDSFARSGTMHILAVSGLHLGILYWLLLQLLGSWRYHFALKWLFVLISLLSLWSFALITGLAASTQRAAIMFSILLLGNTFNKDGNSLNALGTSALIIIWVDPYQLYSVGFQLSYSALGGILYLQPLIARWRKVKNKFLKYFWELITVSLAAQVAVLPLTIYYFHQFPVYFLLANLLLIPLAFAIIVMGIVFFIALPLPSIVFLVAAPLSQLTRLTGAIVQAIGDLPGSTVHDLEINMATLILFYGLLVTLVIFCQTRSRLSWLIILGLLVVAVIGRGVQQYNISQRQMIAVYQIPGHTAVDFIDQGRFRSVMDVELLADTSTIEYKIRSFRRHLKLSGTSKPAVPAISTNAYDLWLFKGKRVFLIKAATDKWVNGNIELKSHIVIVSNNSVKDLDVLTRWLTIELLLIDGSNDPWIAGRLAEQATTRGINVHNCWIQGAKIIKL